MATQTVCTKGIFHGLPTFPDEIQGLSAIITGANGISGYHMLKVLLKSPKRWSRIYLLSRRPPAIEEDLPDYVHFISLDFLANPTQIAEKLVEHHVKA